MKSDAWQQGYEAYDDSDTCPYESGTIQYDDWWAGWDAACDADEDLLDDVLGWGND